MDAFTTGLYARMQQQLQEINQSSGNSLSAAEQSYLAVTEALKELKTFAKEYMFKDREEEILFFKEIKPKFLREVIYFMKIFDVERELPVGSIEIQKAYYSDCLDQITTYFEQNRFLHLYYRMDKSHLDEAMFVSEPQDIPLLPHYTLDADIGFSNTYSYKLAKIQALEELASYLRGYIAALDNDALADDPKEKSGEILTFTGSSALLIEIGYSFKAAGVFNNGNASVRSIFDLLQKSFRIRATHYYSYFQSMRIRKKNRTPGMDMLKENLIRYMDDSDENPRYR